MPFAAKKPCRKPGCPALVDNGYCEDHHKVETSQRNRWRGTSASRGYDGDHRKLRAQALKEALYLCQRCLPLGRVTPATDMHHIRKITTHPHLRLVKSNCIACCRDCHELMEKDSD